MGGTAPQDTRTREQKLSDRLAYNAEVERQRRLTAEQRLAEQKAAERKQRRLEAEAAFEAHRQLDANAAEQGVDIASSRHRIITDPATGERVLQSRGSSSRSRNRANTQFSTSGEPVNLQGDPQAIQQVRMLAFQRARERGQQTRTDVDQAAINRETRNILAQTGGNVSVVDQAERNRTINAAADSVFNQRASRPIGESDDVYLTPEPGLRGRNTFSGFFEGGGKKTVTINSPKTETVAVELKAPPNDPGLGITNAFKNMITDWELGSQGIGLGLGALFGGKPQPLIKQAGNLGTQANLKTERELEGELFGAGIQSVVSSVTTGRADTGGFTQLGKGISESPLYFLGSAAASAATWLSPYAATKLSRFATGAGKVPKFGSPGYAKAHLQNLVKLDIQRADDMVRFGTPDKWLPDSPTVFPSPTFKPFVTSGLAARSTSISYARDFLPDVNKPTPFATVAPRKKITTLADIDKRLGLGFTDKGQFTEVKTSTGQVLLLKKPTQLRTPTVLTKQEQTIIPRLRTTTRQQQQQRFTLGLFGQAGLERILAKRKSQQLGIFSNLSNPVIERDAIRQAEKQSLKVSQQSLFKQNQLFENMFKQGLLTKNIQQRPINFKFESGIKQGQLFKFDNPLMTKTITNLLIPPGLTRTTPGDPTRRQKFPDLGLDPGRKKKKKAGKKGRVQLRSQYIPSPIAAFLGFDTEIGRASQRIYTPEFFGKRGRRKSFF